MHCLLQLLSLLKCCFGYNEPCVSKPPCKDLQVKTYMSLLSISCFQGRDREALWCRGSPLRVCRDRGSLILIGYTNEFKEFMALMGDGASELSCPSAVSLLVLFPLYWPINEPSSLNCPSPPSP